MKTSRDCPTKVRSPESGVEETGPLVYEFQKQENGELKVVTTRDVSKEVPSKDIDKIILAIDNATVGSNQRPSKTSN